MTAISCWENRDQAILHLHFGAAATASYCRQIQVLKRHYNKIPNFASCAISSLTLVSALGTVTPPRGQATAENLYMQIKTLLKFEIKR